MAKFNGFNPYQQNLRQEQPKQQQQNKWYSGSQPTTMEIYGRIGQAYEKSKLAGTFFANQFAKIQQNPDTVYYNPYSTATNRAVSNLQSYGIDTSNINDDWFKQNDYLRQYLTYDGTTNTPTKPGKKASAAEKAAYEYYQIWKSEDTTKKAEQEWAALQEELKYKAGWKDRNMSDDDIINSIDWSKYSTLRNMDDKKNFQPVELNRGISYSKENMYGVLWSARNGGGSENLTANTIAYAMGRGVQYKDNPQTAAKLNRGNAATYSPYSVGMTIDDAGMYFGQYSFDQKWLDEHRSECLNSTDATKQKMYSEVYKAEQNTQNAEKELADIKEKVSIWIKSGMSEENIVKLFNNYIGTSAYSTLNAMDQSIASGGDLVKTTRAVNYRKQDMLDDISKRVKERDKRDNSDTIIQKVQSAATGTTVQPETELSTEQMAEQETKQASTIPVRKKTKRDVMEEAAWLSGNKSITTENKQEARDAYDKKHGAGSFDRDMGFDDAEKIEHPGLAASSTENSVPTNVQINDEKNSIVRNFGSMNAEALDPMEQTVFSGYSVTEFEAQQKLKELSADWKNGDPTAVLNFVEQQTGNVIKGYLENTLGVYNSISGYEGKRTDLNIAQENAEILRSVLGAKAYYGKEQSDSFETEVNGVKYKVTMSPDMENIVSVEQVGKNFSRPVYANPTGNPDEYDDDTMIWYNIINSAETEAKIKDLQYNNLQIAMSGAAEYTAEDYEMLEALRGYEMTIEDCQRYLEDNQEQYEKDVMAFNNGKERLAVHVKNMEDMGVGAEDIETMNTVLQYLTNFNDYEATVWENYNPTHAYTMMLANGDNEEDVLKLARDEHNEITEQLKDIEWLQEYLQEHDIQLPEYMSNNIDRRKAKLERDLNDAEYFELQFSKDFDQYVAAGRQIEQDAIRGNLMAENPYDTENTLYYEVEDMQSYMTSGEADIFYYLLAKDAENGTHKAREYADFLNDEQYGVLHTRMTEATGEAAENLTRSGWEGFLAANAASVIMSPYTAVASGANMIYNALTQKEFNPNSRYLQSMQFRSKTREASAAEIQETFKDNPTMQKIAQGGYEILTNRLDSLANATAFGWMFGGVGSEMLKKFLSAAPMGLSAATEAAARAKERGASDAQAYGVAAVTFFAETATEAVSLENMKGALEIGENMGAETFRTFMQNWLTSAGISEAFGETLNDKIENLADEKIMGVLSEHAALVEQYRRAGKDPDEAELLARKDEMNGLLRTALISFLSPGLDVFQTIRGRYHYYMDVTQELQQQGNNVSLREVRKAIKEQEREANQPSYFGNPNRPEGPINWNALEERYGAGPAQQTTAQETTQQTPVAQQEQTPAESPAAPTGPVNTELMQQMAEAEAAKKKKASSFAVDFEILEAAKNGDKSALNATVAAVLDEGTTQEETDVANATAAILQDIVGENTTSADETQDLLIGANVADVNPSEIKRGLRYAALGGNDSFCRKLMLSEEYKNMLPDKKATLLSEAVLADDMQESVQQSVPLKTRNYRVARVSAELIANGAAHRIAEADKKVDAAKSETQKAKAELETQRNVEAAKAEALQRANENLQADPANPDNVNQVTHAITEHDNASKVTQEYEQQQANAEERESVAIHDAEEVKKEVMTEIRQQAEQAVAQEDQQRAEAAEQAKIEAQAAAEQEEKLRTQQEATNNANVADVDNFINLLRKDNPTLTAEDEKVIRDKFASILQENQTQLVAIEDERGADGKLTENAKIYRNKALEFVNSKFGLPVVLADDITTEDKNGIYSEGFYDENNHRIVLNNDMSFNDVMTRVLPHELLHSLEQSKTYNIVTNSLLGTIYGQDANIEQAIKNLESNNGKATTRLEQDILHIKKKYDNALGGDHSYRYAAQEIAATRMGEMFYNPSNPQKSQDLINRLAAEKPSAARQIMNSIKSMVKKALGMKGAWLTNAQKTVDLFESALSQNAIKVQNQNVAKPATREEKQQLLENIRNHNIDYERGAYRLETIPPVYTNLFDIGELDLTITPRHSYNNMATADEAKAENMYRKGRKDHYHGLGTTGYMEAIDALDEPMIVMDGRGNGKKANPRIAVVIDTKTNGPLLAAIEFYSDQPVVDGDDKRTHALLTIYGKEGLEDYVNTAKDLGKILYVDGKQDRFGAVVQSDSGQSSPAFNDNLAQFNDYVKQWKENRDIHYSLPSEEAAQPIATDDDGIELAYELPGGTVGVNDTKYSLSSFTPEEQSKTRSALLTLKDENGNQRFSEEEVDNYMGNALSIASMIAADRQRLDFTADPEKTMLKPNAEYVKTLDASTLCAKRLLYQGTFDAIQHQLPNTPLLPEDLIDLSNMMRDMGYETPCGICYVESRRRQLGKFTEQWLENYDGEYKPTIDEVTTSDGLENLRSAHPQAYNDFVSAMNKKGTMNPKVVQLRTDYRGEIRDMTPGQIQKVKDIGGLRVQSFSDFETPHLLYMAQAVMDMASKDLTAQAYTKVPNFPWAFGDTGIKINLSLIGKGTGLDESGNLVFDDVEGMPFDEAMKLRDRYSQNVGTILVGINDDHILAAMADPRIDFIIPFHKSGWSKTELERMPVLNEYSDYTDSQNEKAIVGKDKKGNYKTESLDKSKRVNFQPVGENGYWDFTKTGKENAEAYLKMCAEDKRLPKFSQFLVDNGDGSFSLQPDGSTDGYWKTLIDFKMYDNDGNGAPQQAVTPNINMDQAVRILNDYSLERNGITRESNNDLPVAQPVVDRYVEEYKEKHPLDENRIRYSLPAEEQENTEINQEDDYSSRQEAMTIDPGTGKTVKQKYSLPVTNKETLNFLNEQEEEGNVIHTYRTMKLLDGKLVSPKATFINGKVEGDTQLGQWEEAAEHPELVKFKPNGDPYFELKEKERTTPARYNPYMHSSNLMLNDQFAAAYEYSGDNPKLGKFVTVECIVPESEATSGYQAQYAKDPVGWTGWKTGPVATALIDAHPDDPSKTRDVFLSRWIKPVRIVPDSEVAQHYKALLEGTDIKVPANVVTNNLREELEKAGVPIGEPQSQQAEKYRRTNGTKYSLPQDAPYMAAVERGEMDEAQQEVDTAANNSMPNSKIVDEDGNLLKVYHGTNEQFTVFDMSKGRSTMDIQGSFFSPYDIDAGGYGENVGTYYLNIMNPAPEGIAYAALNKYKGQNEAGKKAREDLISQGYDGVANYDEYIAFYPEQIKSADPVTYDDNGNVIPLSERFNAQNPDIRYALPSDDILEDQIRQYLRNGGVLSNQNQKTAPAPRFNQTEPGTGQRQWGREGAQQSDELFQQAKDYVMNNNEYRKDTNAAELNRALDWIQSNRTKYDPDGYVTSFMKLTGNPNGYRTKDGQAKMVALMALAAAKNDVNGQVDLADIYNRQGTALGQALQARKLFRLMTPEGRIASLRKMLSDQQTALYKKGVYTDLKLSDWIYQAAAYATKEGEFQQVQQAAAEELAKQIPANWKDKLRGWRMLSMLGNPRTHIRNVVGNALFVPVVGLKNKLGALMELGTDEKTKTLAPILKKEVRDFARQDAKELKDVLTGEAKYNENTMVQRQVKPFNGLLQSIIDFNGNALEKEDWIFLKGHYRRALGGWMQANGYTAEQLQNDPALLEKGRAYAVQEAQKATYRDFNKLADTLNKVSRQGGVAGFLVDATLPFKKTPANILRRGLEYSPLSLMKSLTTDIYHLKQYQDAVKSGAEVMPEKALSPTQFIDRLCSGLSGTAIMALGALLSSAGIVSCGLDDDDDEFEKQKGNQKYALKFNLLGQDVTFTLDWAAPMSMPFFVGAAIQEQMQNQEGFDVNDLVNAFGNITEPVFNLSMLDGINTLFKTSQYDDTNTLTQIGAKIGSNYVTSYVPSLLGAIARTVDENQRKSFVKSGEGTGLMGTIRYAREQVENKIPGLSQTNIPMRDIWGNAKTSGMAERLLENFILPGYINKYEEDPIINEMARLYEATGDSSMIPDEDPDKSYTRTKSGVKEKFVFTAEEWDKYKEVRGQTAYTMLTDLLETDDYKKADTNVQVQMIKDVWNYANKVGRQAVIPDLEVDEQSVETIGKNSIISGHKNEMIKALDAGDYDAFQTMVAALEEDGVSQTDIKGKIGDTYRDKYKEAFKKYLNTNDESYYMQMLEIEEMLLMTGYTFDTSAWQTQVMEKLNK